MRQLEKWTEGLLGGWLRASGRVGLIRGPREKINRLDSIELGEDREITLEISDLMLVTPHGNLVEIAQKKKQKSKPET